jgi:hypothetical protein
MRLVAGFDTPAGMSCVAVFGAQDWRVHPSPMAFEE